MIIDKKGKLFGKVSIIDIIILALVMMGLVFFFRQMGIKKSAVSGQGAMDLEITFYQPAVNDFTANAIKIGDPAKESFRDASFGEVVDFEIGDSVNYEYDENGEFVPSVMEGYNSIIIKTRAKGNFDQNHIQLQGEEFYIGDPIMFKVGNAIFYGDIMKVEEVKEPMNE